MAIRYRTNIASEHGNDWTVHIHDTDHSGAITDFDTARPGFSLNYAGGENVFHPVVPSSATVPMYIVDTDGDSFLNDLATSNEGRFRMTIRKGNSDTSPLWWVGVLTLDNIIIEDRPFPYVVDIKAVDGLQLLSRMPYTLQTNFSVYNVLLHCLTQIGTSDLFNTNSVDTYALAAINDLSPDVASYDDPFIDVKLRPAVYDVENGVYDYDTDCENILTQVARSYNSRLFMAEGQFHFLPLGVAINAPSNYAVRQWKFDGTYNLSGGVTFTNVLPTTPTLGTTAVRLAGWSSQFQAPVQTVSRPLNYGEGVVISNENTAGVALVPSGAASGTSQQAYTFTTANETPLGATFSIRGHASVLADYIGLSSSRTGRVRIGMKLTCGIYTCQRTLDLHPLDFTTIQADVFNTTPTADEEVLQWDDPGAASWTLSNSDRVHFGSDVLNYDRAVPNFATGQDDSTTIPLDFTTPPLPAATSGNISVTFFVVGYNPNGGGLSQTKKDSTFIDLTFALIAGEGYNGNAVIYTASVANGATEIREEEPVNIGSQVVFSSQYLYNPAEFYNVNGGLPNWNSTLTPSASVGMHEICVRDQAQYFDTPRRIWSGSFQSPAVYLFRSLTYDAGWLKWFTPVSMTMNADSDIYDIELHELSATGAPTSDVVKPGPGKPVPVLVALDSITKRFERGIRSNGSDLAGVIIDVEDALRQSGASGGLSTILLQYLGDVKISGPVDGQVLQYNSQAGRWANVTPSGGGDDNSLSETNQTIDAGVTRDIVLDGSAANLSYFRITDINSSPIFSITNYGTILNIIEYFGLIAYRSTATAQGSIALYETYANGTNFIQLSAPQSLSSNVTLKLPDSAGTNGQALTTDGAGNMSWATVGGGGSSLLPLGNISGRWTWSSADDGERVMTGNTSYGPFNFYSHGSEPNSSTIRNYSSSHVIDSTTGLMPAYYVQAFGVMIPTTDKKVRIDYTFRIQNAPNGSTFGMSMWGVATPTNGTNSSQTFTLRGVSGDSTVSTSSTSTYNGTFTTTSTINGGHILPMWENRTGSLTSTVYIYGQIGVYLVD